VNNSRKL